MFCKAVMGRLVFCALMLCFGGRSFAVGELLEWADILRVSFLVLNAGSVWDAP